MSAARTRPAVRVWIPTTQYIKRTSIPVSVKLWIWTPRGGLRVRYKDGIEVRSDYRTLRNFLSAVATGNEGPVRELSQEEIARLTYPVTAPGDARTV